MKTYDKNIQLKLKTFLQMSLRKKVNLILFFLGIKPLIYKILHFFLSFFIKSKMSFLRRIVFDINTEKSKYLFFENKEKFLLFTRDQVISKECFANDNFEFEKFQKVIDFLKKDYQITKLYDIGANIGVTCIPAVNRALVKQAIAVEPEPENFKLLKLNISLNNLEDKIKIFNYALSSENNKLLNLEVSEATSGGHRIRLPDRKKGVHEEEKKEVKSVMSKTFDSLFSEINSKEDLIWIDAQGFEPNILSGANKMIMSGAPVVIEFWPYALKQNGFWQEMQEIIKKFKFFSDISKDPFQIIEINQKNIQELFSGWDIEESSKHSLFTDLLLLSNK